MENRFYINTEGNDDDAYKQAINYACEIANQDTQIKRIILYITTKQNTGWFERLYGDECVKKIFKGATIKGCRVEIKFETCLTYAKDKYHSPSDIVICCGLDSDDIFKIDDYYSVKYIIAIPWLKKYSEQWIKTWNAKEISGKGEKIIQLGEPSEIVILAMKDLTGSINMSTGITHPMDNDKAKTYIRALHKYEPQLIADEVSSYLIRELGWQTRHAKEIESLIKTLNNGKYFKGGETSGLQHYYKNWKKELQ